MITLEITTNTTTVEVVGANVTLDIVPQVTTLEISGGIAGQSGVIPQLDDDLIAGDLSVNGFKVTLVAEENLAFGDLCYMAASGKWAKGDASGDTTSRVVAMAAGTILADAAGDFLLTGFARDDSWNWTVGGALFLSETVGEFTQTSPITSGSVTQLIGTAIHASRVYFNPSLDIIVHV